MGDLPGRSRYLGLAAALAAMGHGVQAESSEKAALSAFADNCLSPHLTARAANEAFAGPEIRHDFYDLDPFSAPAPSPAAGMPTPGTDRRCEVTFDGDQGAQAAETARAALAAEGITTEAPLPATHTGAHRPGTTLLAARALNPGRVAVVHTGTRPGPNGPETFLRVERLTPEASREALK
ncbi:succinyl-CoA synthetase subunit beta [Jannaschia sp. S6380]|uniref:succinyl-CoA synthetase subunit beta n=1 Tax=Jannaschia sp. S6380 TaxID=2926408 RepID=UPI001FF666AD|nr:succinyl-CoA synthetase subunit beta [Jannaschia sp. S6380]MCK0168159.1 succinyl-CoA synthetase subunit beta [Jannaschia sp. S6380]